MSPARPPSNAERPAPSALPAGIDRCRLVDMKSASALYRLLGDEARLRILRLLAEERLNVSELTAVLGIAQSGVSRHLGLLKESGLVQEEREGGFTYYQAASDGEGPPTPRGLGGALRAVRCSGGGSGGARGRGAAEGSAAVAEGELRDPWRHRAAAGARAQLGRLVPGARPCCSRPWMSPTSAAATAI